MTPETLGQRLARYRRSHGLSQQQIANELGIPRPAVSWMESGKQRVTADHLAQLARLYDVSLDTLYHGEPPALLTDLQARLSDVQACVEYLIECRVLNLPWEVEGEGRAEAYRYLGRLKGES